MAFLNGLLKGVFIVVLTILVNVAFIMVVVPIHEMGHYLMAMAFGHTPDVFSVGFGKVLFSFQVGPTTFQLCAIPLGGYVTPDLQAMSFTALILTLLAGPFAAIFATLALFRVAGRHPFMQRLGGLFIFFGISMQLWNLFPMPFGAALSDGGRILQAFTGFTPPTLFTFIGIVALYFVIDPFCQKVYARRKAR